MKRYFHIYSLFLQLSWSSMLAYRASFINGVISNTVWSLFHVIAIVLLTSRTSSVYGWSRNDLILLAATSHLMLAIFYFFCSRNLREFPETINRGKLDALLLKPVDTQFLVSFQFATFYSLSRIIIGVSIIMFIVFQAHLRVGVMQVLGYMILLGFGIILQYSIWFSIMTLTMWFTTLSNLLDLLYNMNDLARFPSEMYRGAKEVLFLLVFPFTLILIVPVKTFLQRVSVIDIVWLLSISMAFFIVCRKLFTFALRFYTSASG